AAHRRRGAFGGIAHHAELCACDAPRVCGHVRLFYRGRGGIFARRRERLRSADPCRPGAEMRRVRHGGRTDSRRNRARGRARQPRVGTARRARRSGEAVLRDRRDPDSFLGGEVHLMDPESALKALPRALGVKVGMLLAATILIAGGFVLYVLFARGTFEHTQRLYLIAGDVEGVAIGMNIPFSGFPVVAVRRGVNLPFSGFPVGRVRRISVGADGKAKIEIDVREDDAKWLRTSSVFTLESGLDGGAKIRVYSGNLQDPPLPRGAGRPVLRGDTSGEMPPL